jgi:nucleolar GTP-binding protein
MPTIYTAQELLDMAFKHVSKIDVQFKKPVSDIVKAKRREAKRLNEVTDHLIGKISQMVKVFPTFDKLHPFYLELVKTFVDIDEFKQIIASLSGTITVLKRIHKEQYYKIQSGSGTTAAMVDRRAFYGRISSAIKRIDTKLDYLREKRNLLRKLPTVLTDIFTIVVAGYPNVGKSSLVQAISSATPAISDYPFTTRTVIVGHRILDEELAQKVQILDTPGLLDRPLSERNNIELKAIVALKYLANVIVFMIDPSQTCGYFISNQTHLLKEIHETFQNIPFIVNLNKMDLSQPEQVAGVKNEIRTIFQGKDITVLETVATRKEGVEEIFNAAMKYYPLFQAALVESASETKND